MLELNNITKIFNAGTETWILQDPPDSFCALVFGELCDVLAFRAQESTKSVWTTTKVCWRPAEWVWRTD